jgi:hypothetical protein
MSALVYTAPMTGVKTMERRHGTMTERRRERL